MVSRMGRDPRVRDEIRFHRDRLIEEYVAAGMDRREAERRAFLELGNPVQIEEAVRDVRGRWLDDLLRDARLALRSMRRSPAFTVTAVVTLALGIGATTAIFSVIHAVLLRPLPFPDPDRIVWILVNVPPSPGVPGPRLMTLPFEDFGEVRTQSRTLADLSIFNDTSLTLTGQGDPVRVTGAPVSPSMFRLLGASPHVGRLFEPAEEIPGNDRVVLFSHSAWQRHFGSDPDIVGRAVQLDGSLYTVVGVMPAGFGFPDAETELWIPFAIDPAFAPVSGRVTGLGPSIARLRDGVSIDRARTEIQTLFDRLHPPGNLVAGARVELVALQELMVREVRPALLVLLASVVIVLAIACVNVANLLLSRAGVRRFEIALRAALGAGPFRLVRQVLTEALLLTTVGGTVGLIIAYGAIRVLRAIDPGEIPRMDEVALNGTVLAVAMAASLVTGLAFGIVPALRFARVRSAPSLAEGRIRGPSGLNLFGRARANGLLVASEIALTIMLLVGGGLVIHSFTRLAALDPGYDPDNVLTFGVTLPPARYSDFTASSAFYEQALRQIREIPSVQAAGGTGSLPLRSPAFSFFLDFSAAGTDIPNPRARVVTPGYFETMRVPLIDGRLFRDREPAGSIIVNETFQRRFFPGGAVGRQLSSQGRTWDIIGVVGDVRLRNGLDGDVEPEVRINYTDLPAASTFSDMALTLAIRTTGDPLGLVDRVRRVISELDPALAIEDVRSMEDRLYTSVAEPRFYAMSVGIFAAVALALAAVGLYGVLAYAVGQRSREIAIRMALGARRRTVLGMVLFQGMTLTIAGVAAGLLGAVAFTRYLEGMLFGLTSLDPATFTVTTAGLVLTALIACYVPARVATRVDPVVLLRSE